MGDEDEPLKGFSWRSGVERETTGIVLWSDVFLTTNENGDKLAIILMDSQGLFDSSTSKVNNKRIFALGTLVSSIQIFNLYDVIQEDQLEYLKMATDFAKASIKENDRPFKQKPFQKLIFMIRDYSNSDEIKAVKYVDKILKVEDHQPEALKDVRRNIFSSFQFISTYSMPYPGKAMTKKDYDGCWSVMDDDFKRALEWSVASILQPKTLIIKQVYNHEVTANELREYMKLYFKMFESNEDVKPESLYELSVAMQLNILVDKLMDKYETKLYDAYPEIGIHSTAKATALYDFTHAEKIGTKKHHFCYKEILENKIDKFFNKLMISKRNNGIRVHCSSLKYNDWNCFWNERYCLSSSVIFSILLLRPSLFVGMPGFWIRNWNGHHVRPLGICRAV